MHRLLGRWGACGDQAGAQSVLWRSSPKRNWHRLKIADGQFPRLGSRFGAIWRAWRLRMMQSDGANAVPARDNVASAVGELRLASVSLGSAA